LNKRKPRLDKFEQPDFIARLRAGDEMAYQNLVDELATWLAVYINRKFSINVEEAKDIVQDTIMTVYRKIKSYDPAKGKFIQWVFRVLRNQCLDWLRKRKRERLTFRELLAPDLTIQDEVKSFRDDLSPLEKLPREVRAAILRLPGRYQQFVGLMLLGASEDYIMAIMQIKTHSALRSLKSRVLSKLRIEVQ
jgi:RNA polymerase sigma-70 factor (ECF subfamily)